MIKMVVGVLGVTFRMLLRYWAKDSKVLSANIVDAEQFAQQFGLTALESRKFSRTIDEFVDVIAEEFIKEFGSQINDIDRKMAILSQIQEDVERVNINENKLISSISNPEDLKKLIINQSNKERKTWNDKEIGLYTNCVRYISKASLDFVSKLPSFTTNALRLVIDRQQEYHQELHDILMDIHSMTSALKSVDTTYREYESIYRDKTVEKYNKVELIGSGINNARNVTRYDISAAYVELNCTSADEHGEEIELSQVFSNDNVVWIKGEAGSGKTTFLQWIAVCAAKNEYTKIDNIKNTIPIVIELRNIKWPINLQDIVNKITSVYGNNCPDGWILDLLKSNRAILLFDGLDEVNSKKRKQTYDFIEDLVDDYSQIKILLTARNSVKDCLECESVEYEIQPMKTESIKQFVTYWHRSVLRKDAIVEDKEIDRLQFNLKNKIIESQPLKALARNPLLCAMICALNYVNHEQLPENKMELYEKCCEMLMEARDSQRNIEVIIGENSQKLDYSVKRKILEEMSFWMMNGGEASVHKYNAVEFLQHLINDTSILSDRTNDSAEKILDFLIERSGIIREPEEGIIDFIHKSFMEFLAVKAICRNCAWNVLIKEACNVNWKETIIMCFREMGRENVQYVLKSIIHKGESKNDDRYFLIASLCASNAVFIADDGIKEVIDIKIKEMIPPKQSDISEIAQAGTYLLPFLKDSEKYNNDAKERCLDLLERLETEESVPDILSYISGSGNEQIKKYALDILAEYSETVLEEYNVREQLIDIIINSIKKDSLILYDSMLYIIGDKNLSEQYINLFNNIHSLTLFCGGVYECYYTGCTDFLRYLKNCKKVVISGYIRNLDCLQHFSSILDLTIKCAGDFSKAVQNISGYKNLKNVKRLHIEAAKLGFFYINDIRNMRNLVCFELHCKDDKLELNIEDFNYLPKLKKVVLDVDEFLAYELVSQIPIWKSYQDGLEIILETNMTQNGKILVP